ncbi:MAG: AHH domain-containing protein [Cellulomonas sp.]|uniref:AHH domain-containing protein n=1 Tax=Cellulomonas TaxID=1707 RepID=UPI0014771059|nr:MULTISPECIES: AHH domain-containing protein [Cellulomonas]MCR6648959.1 AHH domain-containing protein [Cellulomonas sp.]MCR6704945.1 AHH domain-containing protein [Cellulomonas sp.]
MLMAVAVAFASLGATATPSAAGPWLGSIASFTATPPTVSSSDPFTTFRVELTEDMAGTPYEMYLYKDGAFLRRCDYQFSTCTTRVQVPFRSQTTLTVYVAESIDPVSDAPVGAVASASASATNSGWLGTLGITASYTNVATAPTPYSLIIASPSVPLNNTPYWTSIYAGTNQLCSRYQAGCSKNLLVQPGQVRSLTAVVSSSKPVSGALPTEIVTSSGIVVANLSASDLEASEFVTLLAAQLAAKYGEEACLVLGEKVRTHAARSSVPDVTLVCNARGIAAALRVIAGQVDDVAAALQTLVESVEGDTPGHFDPDCGHVSTTDGTCLDEGTPRDESEPAPQPEPGGEGIGLPPNCVKDAAANDLVLNSLRIQVHHLATDKHKTRWTEEFEEVISQYPSLTLNQDWNLLPMPHRGRHPNAYHQWVLDNATLAAEAAGPDAEEFVRLFETWVKRPIATNPLAVRGAWWRC